MTDTETLLEHRSLSDLKASIPYILEAPKGEGRLDLIVSRPECDLRNTPSRALLTVRGGVEGDHWAKGCWLTTKAGAPHPDVQICIMMSRVIEAITGPKENWPPAGDNLFIEMDLTPENVPPGTRLAIGTALLETTPVPHNGCQKFIDRFGRDACLFVNTGEGKLLRLRGIYARVIEDGEVTVGDPVRML